MIQRIQSVYLLIGALCLAALGLFDSTWEIQAAENLVWFVPAVTIVGAATVAIALIAIFAYKNRPRQVKLVNASQIMTLVLMAILYGGLFLGGDVELLKAGEDVSDLLVLLLPIVAYIFFYLARRSIQRDIDLVKSMDRLR